MTREDNLLAVLVHHPKTGTTKAAELMGVVRSTAMRAVQVLLQSKKIHIAAWETQVGNKCGGGAARPLYALGDLPSAPKPRGGTSAQYKANARAKGRGLPAPYPTLHRKKRTPAKTAREHILTMPAYPQTWTLAELCEESGLQPYYAIRAVSAAARDNVLDVVRRGSNGRHAIYRLSRVVPTRHSTTITPSVNNIFNLAQAL